VELRCWPPRRRSFTSPLSSPQASSLARIWHGFLAGFPARAERGSTAISIENHGPICDLHTRPPSSSLGERRLFSARSLRTARAFFGRALLAATPWQLSLQPIGEALHDQISSTSPGTAVLVTRVFFTRARRPARSTDFIMPGLGDGNCSIVRRVESCAAAVRFGLVCSPAFDYARAPHRVAVDCGPRDLPPGDTSFYLLSPRSCGLRLASPLIFPLNLPAFTLLSLFSFSHLFSAPGVSLTTWQRVYSATVAPSVAHGSRRARSAGAGGLVDARRVFTLKRLTYLPTGRVVAAPTTSLPEQIGGPRKLDYRYCWLRDSGFTMFAFLRRASARRPSPTDLDHVLGYDADNGATLHFMYKTLDATATPRRHGSSPHLMRATALRPVPHVNVLLFNLALDVYARSSTPCLSRERGGNAALS